MQDKFTIEEIKNYLKKQDSIGDIRNNCRLCYKKDLTVHKKYVIYG